MVRFSFLTAGLKIVRRIASRWCCRRRAAGCWQRFFGNASLWHHLVRSWCSENLVRSALTVGRASLLDWALAHDVWPSVAVVDEQSRVAFARLTHGVEGRFG